VNRTWMTLSLLAAFSSSTAALAAKQHKAPEMYAATEAEAGETPVSPVPHPVAMAVNPSARKLMNTPTPSRSRPSRQELAGQAMPNQAAPAAAAGAAYDPVPSDQVDGMGRRLKLVEELIRRHGRAYDYRVHTVRELESVLAKLDGVRKASVPIAAPTATPIAEVKTAPVAADAEPETISPALPTPTEEDEASN
jgi:hypothetical protein